MTMAPERREVTLAHELVREARPRQWIKNLLVFAAPGAAGVLDSGSALWRTIVTFLALCLAATGRRRVVGCRRSASTSATSFKK